MKTKLNLSFVFLSLALLFSQPLTALSKSKPPIFKTAEDADIYFTLHYNDACRHYNNQEWKQAAKEFENVVYYFSTSEKATDAFYFLGVSYFELGEYDFANFAFTSYLKAPGHPQYFEDTVNYKFCIAEYFRGGEKRRLFKVKFCPKWASARTMALSIYDEIIVAIPNNELAARALYSKATLLQKMKEYRDSVDAYQIIIRRFPKNELAPQAYLDIAKAYCQLSLLEFQNPDILGLAELNARKFREDFPRDERVEIADGYVQRIKEIYAKGLCDVGLFYERIGTPHAAAIYFRSSIEEFPDTSVAAFCQERLNLIECIEAEGLVEERSDLVFSNAPEEPMPFDAEELYPVIDPLDSNRLLTDQ
ncbi:MAG: tetratricopeptide repeat protein [Parachlamydiaceae bacterium]|nr:tetratricopeptide repeat protein [Parachlamydiaceae bacterium]